MRVLRIFACLFVSMTLSTHVAAMERRELQALVSQFGSDAWVRVVAWQAFVERYRSAPEAVQVRATHRFFNRMPYRADAETWGTADYWASPKEFIARNAGDCEDFAIAKYHTLLQLGVDTRRLAFLYVRNRFDRAHLVLAYLASEDARSWSDDVSRAEILDNEQRAIVPLSARADLQLELILTMSQPQQTNPARALGVVGGAQYSSLLLKLRQALKRQDVHYDVASTHRFDPLKPIARYESLLPLEQEFQP